MTSRAELPITELAQRIATARQVKRTTCNGRQIAPQDLGDDYDYATRRTEYRQSGSRIVASETPHQNREKRLRMYGVLKQRSNGVVGITPWTRKSDGVTRYQARFFDRNMSYDCAIDAAMKRNRVMAKAFPGRDEVLCDIDAVFARYGCACGKHERGGR